MKGKLKISIDKNITDENFIEYCLNLKASGYDPTIVLVFYILGKRWDLEKFKLLEELLNDID